MAGRTVLILGAALAAFGVGHAAPPTAPRLAASTVAGQWDERDTHLHFQVRPGATPDQLVVTVPKDLQFPGSHDFVLTRSAPATFRVHATDQRPGLQLAFKSPAQAELKIAGIGTADVNAQLVSVGMVEKREIAEIKAAGGVGEMLGKFFDARGRVLETTLTARTLAVRLDASAPDRIIAIAGGPEKVEPIRAVLASGRLNGLITDEATARAIVSASAGART